MHKLFVYAAYIKNLISIINGDYFYYYFFNIFHKLKTSLICNIHHKYKTNHEDLIINIFLDSEVSNYINNKMSQQNSVT